MPIEFRCLNCARLLRTPDDTAGKQAQCPECGKLTTVPGPEPAVSGASPLGGAASGTPFGAGAAPPSRPTDAENPYQAPTQYGQAPRVPYMGVGPPPASRVAGPAIALIVTGALGAALSLGDLILTVLLSAGLAAAAHQPDALGGMMFQVAFGIVGDLFRLAMAVLVILGALKMKNLENYGFAMAAAIIAMVPCISPCCCLGLPFGIWAIVVLCDAQVKTAFRA
jgi:hypothetical protein